MNIENLRIRVHRGTQRSARARFRDLPLFWKLLVPFLALLVTLATPGTFLLVRSLSTRANQNLNSELAQRSLAARSAVHDRELYVLESATFAANLQGMAQAVIAHDQAGVEKLLQSVLALKTDVTLVATTDRVGNAIAQFSRPAAGGLPTEEPPARWSAQPVVGSVLAAPDEVTTAGFLGSEDRPMVALARTVCAGNGGCQPVGSVVVAVDASAVAADANHGQGGSVALFDASNHLVTSVGRLYPNAAPPLGRRDFLRETESRNGTQIATLYSGLSLQGHRAGLLSVSMPTAPAFSAVRGAAFRLGGLMLAAMIGVVAIGALLSKFILAQVRPLVITNRALEAGNLSARAPVLGHDELGELAQGVNNMASALQESHETLEARVDERTAEVQRLLRERTDFFTAVSHEFRTPLAVILGQAKMLGDRNFDKGAAWHAQASAVLSDAGNQLLGFVNDILEIAKLESGRTHLDLGAVDLGALARSLRPTMETLTDRSGLVLTMRVARRLAPVIADETRLRQVILNLVDNAVKYTPAGGKVTLSVKQVGDGVTIAVSDTGVGIPPEALDRLFEPFYRVKGNETQGGQPSSGLGLALVDGLVDAMGGDITVESSVGKGTTFSVYLPPAGSGKLNKRPASLAAANSDDRLVEALAK